MPVYYKLPPRLDTVLSNTTPLCPVLACGGRMAIESVKKRTKGTGLEQIQCGVCQHRGFRSLGGVHVLFGGRHEYVCGYGPSATVLAICLSETALCCFLDAYLSPTESALYVAHWTLLRGQVAGTVTMDRGSTQFSDCYGHFCREYFTYPERPDDGVCQHDYQLETVGGVYLTGAYVCRLCSCRVGMSHNQFHQHADYPRHYQESGKSGDSDPAPDGRTSTPAKGEPAPHIMSPPLQTHTRQ